MGESIAVRSRLLQRGLTRGICVVGLSSSFFGQCAIAQETSPELIQPSICSAETAGQPALAGICTVTPLGNGHNRVKVNLVAKTTSIEVGGYKVTTENYNNNYLTPVIEAMPGDKVAAHLENLLDPRAHGGMAHGDADENPTNLHYFHGGIVTPNNARPKPAELGDGDNIYVHLKAGRDQNGSPNSFDFKVPIPGEKTLDARVLEGKGYISHPNGLNWYHSHLHGISSDQVMGGMSGLLSVGDAKANVKAACKKHPKYKTRCLNDVDKDTAELKDKTEVRYALLRDIPLRAIGVLPDDASGANAEWAPQDRDFPTPGQPEPQDCAVWKKGGSEPDPDERLRKGFCQRAKDSAWLFTLNGQRFPTITVDGNSNLLLRIGNVSANIAYWLELYNEADGTVLPLTLLSLDGVVPQKPASPSGAKIPVEAFDVKDLLLMPASRAEIYVRNDNKLHRDSQVFILRTKGLDAGTDQWPAIQLARVVLKPNSRTSTIVVALNAPVVEEIAFPAKAPVREEIRLPEGCVRDFDPTHKEYRRVTFLGSPTRWSIQTEIVRPPKGSRTFDEDKLKPADPKETTIGPLPFEDYVQQDGLIDWSKRHVCIFIDHALHEGSHKQLWVLYNTTGALHNFHIHQMKFRLATKRELQEHHIRPPKQSHACSEPVNKCLDPDFKFYDERTPSKTDPESKTIWHDTIPMPPGMKVFLIMSFDAQEQIGRFVFHCHILKHEDNGLMAPIEVWGPKGALLQ